MREHPNVYKELAMHRAVLAFAYLGRIDITIKQHWIDLITADLVSRPRCSLDRFQTQPFSTNIVTPQQRNLKISLQCLSTSILNFMA